MRLGDTRVLDWSLQTARHFSDGIVVVVPADMTGEREAQADVVVAGGATRSASVRAGLTAVPTDVEHVLVHDAARPVPVVGVWQRVVDALTAGAEAVVPAIPVTDTLREIGGGVVDRTRFVAVQTPQGFRAAVLRAAHGSGAEATDDAALVESVGGTVVVVDGDPTNIKITDALDLTLADILTR